VFNPQCASVTMNAAANAVAVDYGQRPAEAEIRAAEQVCREMGISHHVLRIDCSALGAGDMRGTYGLAVVPTPEWWPFRDQMLVTFAAAHLLRFGVNRMFIGTLRSDSVNGDGTKAFVEALDLLLALQEGAIRLEAPAIEHDAVSLVRVSGVPQSILCRAQKSDLALPLHETG
jgi:7-cyano-7-deazaguanine synthase